MVENIRGVADWLIKLLEDVSGALTMEQALHEIVEQLKDFLPHQSLAVVLVDENTDHLTIKTSRQISYSFAKKFNRPINGAVVPRVLLRHEPVCLNGLRADAPEYAEVKLEYDLAAACISPIMHSQRAIGYLHCDREQGDFSDEECRLLRLVGLMIGFLMEKFDLLVLSRHLARFDEASKALKYHAFLDEYRREAVRAKSYQTPLSLIFLDVDDYTGFVQTCGIEAGHALLERIHNLIKQCVREIDIIGRFSADEFIICLGGMPAPEAAQALEKIRVLVQRDAAPPSSGCVVTVSGVVMTMAAPADFEVPLEKVLAALGSGLITARVRGRNQVASIDPPGR